MYMYVQYYTYCCISGLETKDSVLKRRHYVINIWTKPLQERI